MMFLDMQNTRRTLNERLHEREWWFFLLTEGYDSRFLNEIEDTYYQGDKNHDFEMVMMPGFMPPLVAVVMIKKEHISAEQLAGVMTMYVLAGMPVNRKNLEMGLEHQDIICLDVDEGLVARFTSWVGDREALGC